MEEKISSELKLTELKQQNLRQTFDQIHNQASSILSFTLLWKEIEDDLDFTRNSIKQSLKEAYSIQESNRKKEEELQEREKKLEEISKEIELKDENFRIKEKEFEQKGELFMKFTDAAVEESFKEIELKKKELDERCIEFKEIELKQKKFEEWQKQVELEIELKEKGIEKSRKVIEEQDKLCRKQLVEIKLKEKQLDERCREIELENNKFVDEIWSKEKQMEQKSREVESAKTNFVEQAKELEWKEKQLDDRRKEIELENRRFIQGLKLKEKQLDERCKQVELESQKFVEDIGRKEKQFEEQRKGVELESKKNKKFIEELESKKRQVEQRCKAVELAKKKLEEQSMELVLKEKQLAERCKEVELESQKFVEDTGRKEKQVEEQRKEVELESEKNKKFIEELESKKKQVEERCKAVELAKKKLEERSIELLLKEKQLAERCKEVELENKKLTGEIKSKEKQLDDRCKEVELGNKSFEEQRKELEMKEKNLEEQLKEVELAKKTAVEQFKELELKERQRKEPVDANLCSVVTIDGKAFQLFLNEHCKEHDSKRNEVEVVLRLSSDPAMLVLNALEGFYPPPLKKGDLEFEASIVRRSCLLLLEQLMKISPEIQHYVKKRAINIASDWNKKMRLTAGHSLEVLGFLQLLASYGLASAFNSDKLLKYLRFVSEHRKAPELFRILGFSDKICGFIHDLIGKKRQVAAVNFICAFDLINEFPPGPSLLKDYLNNSEINAKRMCSSNKSLEAQTQTTKKRIVDLRAVLRCIEDHKIESELSPEDLKKQIEFWIKEKSKREIMLSNLDCESQLPNPNEKKCLFPKDAAAGAAPITERKSSANTNTKSSHSSSTAASSATPTEAVAATTTPFPTAALTKAGSPITTTAPVLPTTITSPSSTVAPMTTAFPTTTVAPTSPTIAVAPTSVKPKIEPEQKGRNKRPQSQKHKGKKRPRVMMISEVPPQAYFRDSGYHDSAQPHWQQPAGWFMRGSPYLNRAARDNAFNGYTSTNLQLNPGTMPYPHMPMPPWRY